MALKSGQTGPLGLTQCPIFLEPGDFYVTSPYGPRINPVTGLYQNHSGVDGVRGDHELATIVAIEDGQIIDMMTTVVGHDSVYTKGNYVKIKHSSGRISLYLHMAYQSIPTTLHVGTNVAKGEKIGYMGDTGSSTSAHIHFQVYDIDGKTIMEPTQFLLGRNINSTGDEENMYVRVRPCQYKDRGDQVRNLQIKISQLSEKYMNEIKSHSWTETGGFDGVFGKGLVATVQEIQGELGMAKTGVCDQALCNILNKSVIDYAKQISQIKQVIS